MISAVIITKNEGEKIGSAIKSAKGVADEVIVVDSGSTDSTQQIAKDAGAKIFFRQFDNFANQKNWAVSKANGDWILAVDADELIPDELAAEILEIIKDTKYAGFLIPRRNFILGDEIKHSRWSPDTHIWLWRKNAGQWVGDVHEEVKVLGQTGLLKNSKIHNSHKTVSLFLKANELYSTLEAALLFTKKVKFSFLKMMRDALFEFFIRFTLKAGFLDGKRGFILSYLMGIYKLTVWIKVWEKWEKEKQR